MERSMRNILKKLHISSNQSEEESDGPDLPSTKGSGKAPFRQQQHQSHAEPKPLSSAISNWLNSVSTKHGASSPNAPPPPWASSASSSPSSSIAGGERRELRDGPGTGSSVASEAVVDAVRRDSESSRPTEAEVPMDPDMEEEYQIQMALELSAREDPEAAQIEAVKQMSLGSCPPENTPAEVIAYRYWNYNSLNYDDKIMDGFYDVYGILVESTSAMMPSLIDLQGTPVSDSISWEAVLVNKAEDAELSELEQKALLMVQSDSESSDSVGSDLVRRLAILVANYMGGIVYDPDSMLKSYKNLSNYLRASVGNMVLPLGRLTIGLARHRALLFKVLADDLGISCRLVKGKLYTGSDDGALDIVKLNDGREYIVDLMSEPGTLIPSDGIGLAREFEDTFCVVNPSVKDVENIHLVSGDSGVPSSAGCYSENELHDKRCMSGKLETSDIGEITMSESSKLERQISSSSAGKSSAQMYTNENVNTLVDSVNISYDGTVKTQEAHGRPNQPYAIARSTSWTEGPNSPAVRRMKVRDVSQYMINAAKENPQLAQRLHDVLLESGVVAPPDLFAEIGAEQPEAGLPEEKNPFEDKDEMKKKKHGLRNITQAEGDIGSFLPHLPTQDLQRKVVPSRSQLDPLKPVEGLGLLRPLDFQEAASTCSSESEGSAAQLQENPLHFIKHMPFAAAAATAAVVASSMVVAAAKSNTEMNLEVPVAAAATATAAAVVATTAAVNRQYEHLEPCAPAPVESGSSDGMKSTKNSGDAVVNLQLGNEHGQPGAVVGNLLLGSDYGPEAGLEHERDTGEIHQEMERTSDKSTGTESAKSDITLDDVAEFEILWEDIILGERIGLGSFGEVYRGDWHGTEVAVKRFLHQDISNDALEEFRSEVRIMKRLRHPNVVLFMGAVTRVPNLSIVTEFLPRGSLFRLIHRPNNQLDERRRLRMALDVARGMNYLHNCTPIIVHRDLKSPNLLVDKNWVVKVCDFGLSRIKLNTFLSSRSTAGTAEWMAPEVLRNEPSDEKCDVFSFGVILWELCTLQQPWDGMNAMQVVGAVGFQHRRLDIPDDINPVIADMIQKCWHTDPKMRPSFYEIMAALKPLQKPVSSTQVLRQRVQVAESSEKGRS